MVPSLGPEVKLLITSSTLNRALNKIVETLVSWKTPGDTNRHVVLFQRDSFIALINQPCWIMLMCLVMRYSSPRDLQICITLQNNTYLSQTVARYSTQSTTGPVSVKPFLLLQNIGAQLNIFLKYFKHLTYYQRPLKSLILLSFISYRVDYMQDFCQYFYNNRHKYYLENSLTP